MGNSCQLAPPCAIVADASWMLMVVLGIVADGARLEGASPEQIQTLWCLIGGLGGSICSTKFFQVKGWFENCTQVVVNLILSAGVAPVLCDYVSNWTGYPNGMRLAILVSGIVGLFGQQTVNQLIPLMKKILDRRSKKWAKFLAGDNPNDDSNDSTKPLTGGTSK